MRIKGKPKKKRALPKDFKRHRIEKIGFPQYSLCEAMQYVQSGFAQCEERNLDVLTIVQRSSSI